MARFRSVSSVLYLAVAAASKRRRADEAVRRHGAQVSAVVRVAVVGLQAAVKLADPAAKQAKY